MDYLTRFSFNFVRTDVTCRCLCYPIMIVFWWERKWTRSQVPLCILAMLQTSHPPFTRAISQSSGQCDMQLQLSQREDSWLFFFDIKSPSLTTHNIHLILSLARYEEQEKGCCTRLCFFLDWLEEVVSAPWILYSVLTYSHSHSHIHTHWLSIGRAKSQTLRSVGLLFVRTVHKGIPRLTGWWLMVDGICKASVYFNKLRVRKI